MFFGSKTPTSSDTFFPVGCSSNFQWPWMIHIHCPGTVWMPGITAQLVTVRPAVFSCDRAAFKNIFQQQQMWIFHWESFMLVDDGWWRLMVFDGRLDSVRCWWMLTDVAGLFFFPHLWPLGIPQRESSSLELVQNCQMLPPEHSCISVHTIHTTSYFLTLDWFIQTRPRERPERSQPVTSQCWSSQVPRLPMDFQWISNGCSHGRVAEGSETTFSGATTERPAHRSQGSANTESARTDV